jgi:hypothetical protein
MSNPFEAAIKLLAHAYRPPLESGAQCGSTLEIGRAGQEFTDEQHEQFLAAIRVLEAAGTAREAKERYIQFGLSEWGNYMTAIGAVTEAALPEVKT